MTTEISWIIWIGHYLEQAGLLMRWLRNQCHHRPSIKGRIGVPDELLGSLMILFVKNYGDHHLASIFWGVYPKAPSTEEGHYVGPEYKVSRELRHGQEGPFTDLHTVNCIASRGKGKRKVLVFGLHINFIPFLAFRIDHFEGTEFGWIHSLRLPSDGRDSPPNHQRS